MSDQTLPWTHSETELLNSAVEKLIRAGEQVGVTAEDMITLLDSGCSMHNLLVLLASKRNGVA